MKTIRHNKRLLSIILTLNLLFSNLNFSNYSQTEFLPHPIPPPADSNMIKMALLLDTSSSMNGLLEQAKSQLWKIVNELALASKKNEQAHVEFALYQYGNDGLESAEGYIQNVLPLSTDLDLLSEKLFALTTNGGNEYCGYAIETATNQLDWEVEQSALNLIFIAGNEPFNQGPKDFNITCKSALEKGITINTIFCGDAQQGVNSFWKKGADITEGSYMNIDMNQKTVYVETPYDDKIDALNDSLNATYLAYGSEGSSKKMNQLVQDNNSAGFSKQNKVQRAVSKSSHIYDNRSWDLVDASKEKEFKIEKIATNSLPQEMQKMTLSERTTYLESMKTKREQIQQEIKELNTKRTTYIASQSITSSDNSLDAAMISAIRKQAVNKGFEFSTAIDDESNIKEEEYNKTPYVNFDFFEKLVTEVKPYRKKRLIEFDEFNQMSKEENTIILDTRSKKMYDDLHIKGAINSPFAEFTQHNLNTIIPSNDTRILIYCNNNFAQDNSVFIKSMMSKAYNPNIEEEESGLFMPKSDLSLALNIPTFINLYGYGYKNVYELEEMLFGTDTTLKLEGKLANSIELKNLSPFLMPIEDTTSTGKPRALVNYEYFEKIMGDTKKSRAEKLISFKEFNAMSKREDVIILDTRSKEMYDRLHVKGAVHLEFSEFTQKSLNKLIPNTNTKILIYCNNNFSQNNPIFREDFASKVSMPRKYDLASFEVKQTSMLNTNTLESLALNIPTYINLKGYGYTNIYELGELVYANNPLVQFEGTDANKLKTTK